eukprot:CAMPEP_0194069490 /NCGR_PEP_ID=MMETSP0009_2-20130614/87667_1 /TAXON_ID=210454 /ORGANISM="Grammatophora oceanica, Strain CCMP 410" /LENGTH=57 /DNA_ID=CAMNT_0038722681 /DNA_START=486 /DNA_END=659 /DNA_ORIENTATION=+
MARNKCIDTKGYTNYKWVRAGRLSCFHVARKKQEEMMKKKKWQRKKCRICVCNNSHE